MAWDTENTKQQLLDAATVEFSAYGLAGGRVDRIAKNAGVNKERIYKYCGNKEQLFGLVLARQLAYVMDQVQITGTGVEAVVDYAGPLSGWGEVVILNLGPGWRAVIAGLDSVSVEAGGRVTGGQTLGRSADDGEVYFELRRDERPVDPSPWLE